MGGCYTGKLSSTTLLRVGVVGAGQAAEQLHWPALHRVREIQVISVADVDRDRAAMLASSFPGAAAESEASKVFSNPAVEAVAILTPPQTHRSLVFASLSSGKHVFVEKPLTVDPAEADELVAKARASGRVVAVGHNLRFHRLAQRARSLLKTGALGELLAISAVWTTPRVEHAGWRDEPELGGGVLLDLGVHHADLFAYLAGSPIGTMTATIAGDSRQGETASVSGRFQSNALFSSVLSQRGVHEHGIHLAGTAAAVEFSFQRANSWRVISKGQVGLRAQLAEMRQYVRQAPDVLSTMRTGGDWAQSYVDQWRAFVRAIREGDNVICSIKEAAAAVKFCSSAGLPSAKAI